MRGPLFRSRQASKQASDPMLVNSIELNIFLISDDRQQQRQQQVRMKTKKQHEKSTNAAGCVQ